MKAAIHLPKMRYCVECVGGDYYYREMSMEEAMSKAVLYNTDPKRILRSWTDVDRFVQDNINIKMPLDGPLWSFEVVQAFIDGRESACCMWKSHHSFCDGVSIMCMSLAMSVTYDRSYFVKTADISLLQQILLKLMVPFYIPLSIWKNVLLRGDKNIITAKKRQFSGQMNAVCSNRFNFPDIKLLSKQLGCTINDVVTTSITTSMNQLFKENEDEAKSFTLVMPANIRFGFYETRESLKLENIFTAIPVKLPMTSSMESGYAPVRKVMNTLKGKLPEIYTAFAMSLFFQTLLPKTIPRRFVDKMTKKFTLAFSNVPGPIKQFYYESKNGEKI